MTNQEVFEKVVRHLRAQGEKSLMPGCSVACAYRGENGRKCAVGCLIADEHYAPDLEWQNTLTGRVKNALKASGVEMDSYDLLTLQEIHDHRPVDEWEARLADFAEAHGYTMPSKEVA